jgi:hypothetical protein
LVAAFLRLMSATRRLRFSPLLYCLPIILYFAVIPAIIVAKL